MLEETEELSPLDALSTEKYLLFIIGYFIQLLLNVNFPYYLDVTDS